MQLPTAESFYPRDPDKPDIPLPARALWIARRGMPVTQQVTDDLRIEVRVNHGRWIADCPFCSGAQMASFTDPRFLCADCGNINVGGKWIRLVWPGDARGIEVALLVRSEPNRNWRPGETIAALRNENAQHGVEGAV